MALLVSFYARSDDLLQEVAALLAQEPVDARVGKVVPVEAPQSLNIDLATVAGTLWEALAIFGTVAGTVEAFVRMGALLRERRANGLTHTLELVGPDGAKLTIQGTMTPDQVRASLAELRSVLGGGSPEQA
jgi:hypothetical protein